MKYKLSKRSLNNAEGIDSVLIDILTEGITNSPFDYGVPSGGGFRTDKDQIKMYAIGRTTHLDRSPVTWTLNSYHKSGNAFDIFAYVDGGASWDMEYLEPIARHLQKVAQDLFCVDLEWGFDLWGKDGAHFQIKE
jgi:hypothetical protein